MSDIFKSDQALKTLEKSLDISARRHRMITNNLANMETTLRQLTSTEFSDLYRHGFEVADVTLHAFDTERFKLIGYHPDDHPAFQ